MEKSIDVEKIAALPRTPGVYLFKDAAGVVLYVGKATSLRNRVRQYFSGQEEKSRGRRMRHLVERTTAVETRETESVLEALILEAELIKKYQPKYNVEGKDDKSYAYFVITKEEFPRVLILRATDFDKTKNQISAITRGKKFGPYTSTGQMRTALRIIRKIFPFHNRAEKSEKGCLSYQIGLCPGPYDGAISKADYARNMRHISLFLSGCKKALVQELEKAMRAHARAEAFEEAAQCKRQIYALTHINDIALISKETNEAQYKNYGRVEAYDISHISGEQMVASMVVFYNGVPDKKAYRKFTIKAVEGINDVAAMREVLARRMNHVEDWGVPQAIVLDGGQGHLNMAEKLFTDLGAPRTIGLLAVAKGPTRKKVDVYASKLYPADKEFCRDVEILESLREAAHRFAISYHKKLRDKSQLSKK